jgi:hypothetical protein
VFLINVQCADEKENIWNKKRKKFVGRGGEPEDCDDEEDE